jgi:hypothetical protein
LIWKGESVAGVDKVIAWMDQAVQGTEWTAVADVSLGYWQVTFKDAPLPQFSTLTSLTQTGCYEPGKDFCVVITHWVNTTTAGVITW